MFKVQHVQEIDEDHSSFIDLNIFWYKTVEFFEARNEIMHHFSENVINATFYKYILDVF